jgi:hypothetical protein
MYDIDITGRRYDQELAEAEHQKIISGLSNEINDGNIGTLNFVIAHPDDMLYGVGFFDSLLEGLKDDSGLKINVHVLTDGEAGVDLTNPYYDASTAVDEGVAAFRDTRMREEYRAWGVLLGGRIREENFNLLFHGLPDSRLGWVEDLEEQIADMTYPEVDNEAEVEGVINVTIDNSERRQDHRVTMLATAFNSQDKNLIILGTKPSQHQAMVAFGEKQLELFEAVVEEYPTQLNGAEHLPEPIARLREGSYYSFVGRAAMPWQGVNHEYLLARQVATAA